MTIIIKDGTLTEEKKQQCYQYSGFFKIINQLSNIIQELENAGRYVDTEDITSNAEQIKSILDKLEEQIEYRKKQAESKIYWEQKTTVTKLITK